MARLPALKQIAERLRTASETIYALEDRLLFALYGKAPFDRPGMTDELARASAEWKDLLLSVFSIKWSSPDFVTLAVFSENAGFLFELAGVYYRLAVNSGADLSMFRFRADQSEERLKRKPGTELFLLGRTVIKERVDKPAVFLASPIATVVGIAVGINGRFAHMRYGFERGVHTFAEKQKRDKCLVEASYERAEDYRPAVGIERRGSIANQERRRLYNYDELVIEDMSLKTKLHFQGRAIEPAVAWACEERMMREARSMLEPA
jgi:hypothetical protein